jgi:hypothetical protein
LRNARLLRCRIGRLCCNDASWRAEYCRTTAELLQAMGYHCVRWQADGLVGFVHYASAACCRLFDRICCDALHKQYQCTQLHLRLQAVGCGARLCQDILKQHTLQAGILSFCVCLRVWIALRLHLQQRPLNGIEAIVCALYQQCVFDSALVPQRSCNISCVWWCAAPSLS